MTLLGPVRLAVRSLFFGSDGVVLTRRERALLGAIAALGMISFVFEGFGLFALMAMVFRGSAGGLTFGALLGIPAESGILSTPISALSVILLVVARLVANPILNYGLQVLSEKATYRIRLDLLTLSAALPAINAGAIPSGELSTIINDEVSRCGRALASIVTSLQLLSGVAFSVVFLIARDPGVNIAAILSTIPALGLYAYVAALSSADTRRVVEARVQAASRVTEGLRGLAAIQAAGGGSGLLQTFSNGAEEMRRKETKIYFNQTLLQYAMALVPLVASAGAFLYVWYWLDVRSPQQLAAILMPTAVVGSRVAGATSAMVMSVYATSVYATSFVPVAGLFARLRKLSRRNVELAASTSLPPAEQVSAVELRGCSFQLPNGVWLFRDLSLSCRATHPIVVRGASGTGKSTLASVIAGANEPTEGRAVYLLGDGREIAPREGYANYLSQDPAVVAGSLRQNLLLGSHDRVEDSVLEQALKQVRLWEEVRPNGGLDAPVFEGGRNLSGGQIRRLGLARLLTRDRGLWIFDEATASLDPQSGAIVEGFIRDIALTRPVLIISHDPEFRIAGTEIHLVHNESARLLPSVGASA